MKKLTINGIAELIKLALSYRLAPESILSNSDITIAMLSDPDATIRSDQEFQVIKNLMHALQRPSLGLEVGKRYRLSVLGVLGAAVPNAENVREAIGFFLNFINLSYTYFEASFEESKTGGTLYLKDQENLGELRRYFLDRDLLFVMNIFRDFFPQIVLADHIRIHVGYEQPEDCSAYLADFACPLSFAEGDSYIVFDTFLLEHPLPQSNALTLKLMEKNCLDLGERLSGHQSMQEKITHYIMRHLHQPASLEAFAASIGVSERTVRRQLQQEGVSFHKLRNALLAAEATRLLGSTNWTIERIADFLGYSETAAFNHAFKKWTALSPSEYRKRNN